MNIHKITTIEDQNTGKIYLHKEGFFWKAYQQSSYIFTQEIKAFKISKKWAKTVEREVVSIGFPENALEKFFNEEQLTKIDEKQIVVTGYLFRVEDYQQWLAFLSFTVRNVSKR